MQLGVEGKGYKNQFHAKANKQNLFFQFRLKGSHFFHNRTQMIHSCLASGALLPSKCILFLSFDISKHMNWRTHIQSTGARGSYVVLSVPHMFLTVEIKIYRHSKTKAVSA